MKTSILNYYHKIGIVLIQFFALAIGTLNAQNVSTIFTSECDAVNRQIIVGDCIGSNGMKSVDADGDEQLEMVMANSRYWYVMEYNANLNNYEAVWMSKIYGYYDLDMLDVFDIDKDGESEVIVISSSTIIEIFNLETKELESQITLPWNYSSIYSIFLSDADNDGTEELVIGTSEYIFLYKRVYDQFEYEQEYYEGGTGLKAGDVDNDGKIELIYPGRVMRLENEVMSLVWEYEVTNPWGILDLADVDSDGLPEIILAKAGVTVYDADIQQTKWDFDISTGVDALLLYDTDNNGTKELIVGESQLGEVYCLNISDGSELWYFDCIVSGVTNFCAGDLDYDGTDELFFAAGCNSSGPDYIYVYHLADQALEWTSKDIQGPVEVVKVADVDDDQLKEIITLTHSSGSHNSGIITVFDANGEIEWQSTEEFITTSNTEGMKSMEITDIDNDGDTEIVIAAGETYNAAIWVIDGSTHEIESSYSWPWSSEVDDIDLFNIADVDNNGSREYVAASGRCIIVVNPDNYEVTWKSPETASYQFSGLLTDNIDLDSNPEIIAMSSILTIFDGITKESWQVISEDSYFVSLYLYDYDNDGIKDIFTGTDDGEIIVTNGITHEMTTLDISADDRITSIYVGNVTNEGTPEIFYMTPELIYFSKLDGTRMIQKEIDNDSYTGSTTLEVSDINNDGIKEVFAGTNYALLQFSTGCFGCLDFDVDITINGAGCNSTDGSASALPLYGYEPYTWLWSTGAVTSSISNVPMGTYTVTINDSQGCAASSEVFLPEIDFAIDSIDITDDNPNTLTCEGKAVIFPSGGHSPYRCIIKGDTLDMPNNTIYNLCKGIHLVTFLDAIGCTVTTAFQVSGLVALNDELSSFHFNIYPVPAQKVVYVEFPEYPAESPKAMVSNIQGILLKTVNMDESRITIDVSDLAKGVYLITVICGEKKTTRKLVVN